MAYEPKVTVGPRVPVDDLDLNLLGDNTRWGAPVNYGPEYLDILRWLGTQCSNLPEDVYLIAQSREGDITPEVDGTPVMPTVIQWGTGAGAFRSYAAHVGYTPHNARVDVIRHFGGGDIMTPAKYTPPAPPLPDGEKSPVGDRWPEMDARVGGKAYRPAKDNPKANGHNEGDIVGGFKLTFVWVMFTPVAVWVKVA